MVGWLKGRIAGTLVLGLLPSSLWGVPAQKKPNPDRPTLPYSMLGLHREDIEAYDTKAEPVARVSEALLRVDQTGWGLIHKYSPTLGTSHEGPEKKVHPEDPADRRFFASNANEDLSFIPIPPLLLLCSIQFS